MDAAFEALAHRRTQAVLGLQGPHYYRERKRVCGIAIRHGLPGIFEASAYPEAGCLMSYGTSLADLYRRSASYVDKILRGAKAADLPVEQPTKFELVINLKTAKALGLTVPPSVLLRADRVIE
jgi:putative ABC transport system substrate-binding protein